MLIFRKGLHKNVLSPQKGKAQLAKENKGRANF